MESTSRAPVRIEAPSFKPPNKGLCWLWLCLLSSVVMFVGIGMIGPAVFITTESKHVYPLEVSEDSDTATWVGRLTDMTKLHQLIYLEAEVKRPENITSNVEFTYQQEIIVTALGGKHYVLGHGTEYKDKIVDRKRHIKTITCKAGESWCSTIAIFATHQVLYEEYRVAVEFVHPGELGTFCPHCTGNGVQNFYVRFGMHYINPNFTRWQICWKILFTFVTLLVMILPCNGGLAGYFYQLRKVLRSNWTDLQVWIGVLLGMLFFFNDPLFLIEVFFEYGALLSAVYILFLCAFLSTLMFFWLCMLHETSKVGGRIVEGGNVKIVKGIGFYLPKVIFCAMFWILITVAYIYVRVAQEGDPSYDALEDSMHYKLITTTVSVAMAIYTGWILYHALNAMGNVKKLPPQILFTFLFSVLMIVLVIICMGIGATYPLPSASYEFLMFYGLTNVYVWTLAFAYAPLYSGSTALTEESDGIEVGPLSAAAV
ncbi:hypothetical protein TrST_g11081 [Triparma strigata]|uniref:Wntless-like transmembrane domain-containing protein n=1 Tax=Triparma strigata TaxID=1606541 RepID=A0A9W7AF09_9STRA|nr:hypothetical protein TrST_g11081 [Triparma strigata]